MVYSGRRVGAGGGVSAGVGEGDDVGVGGGVAAGVGATVGAAESVGGGCGAMAGVDNLPTSHTAPPMSRPARHSVRIIHLSDFCNICPPLPR